MKPNRDNSNPKAGFTIVELLTVMSIIVVLISLLMPALNRVRRYATRVKQKAQFHSITVALDLFNAENEGYPPSDRYDGSGGTISYCGAMKLAEAMVGEDLKGFDPNSRFRVADIGTALYPSPAPVPGETTYNAYVNNLKTRKMYLQLEKANVYRFGDVYTQAHIAASVFASGYPSGVDPCNVMLLCDSYVRTMATGNKTGMPILYYKAETNKNEHDANQVTVGCTNNNIYNYCDNIDLIDVKLPWIPNASSFSHPMASSGTTSINATANAAIFYQETQNAKIMTGQRPYMADSYILISAGFDGEYGTSDDVFNFGD